MTTKARQRWAGFLGIAIMAATTVASGGGARAAGNGGAAASESRPSAKASEPVSAPAPQSGGKKSDKTAKTDRAPTPPPPAAAKPAPAREPSPEKAKEMAAHPEARHGRGHF
jgi:hypothetical protein